MYVLLHIYWCDETTSLRDRDNLKFIFIARSSSFQQNTINYRYIDIYTTQNTSIIFNKPGMDLR